MNFEKIKDKYSHELLTDEEIEAGITLFKDNTRIQSAYLDLKMYKEQIKWFEIQCQSMRNNAETAWRKVGELHKEIERLKGCSSKES